MCRAVRMVERDVRGREEREEGCVEVERFGAGNIGRGRMGVGGGICGARRREGRDGEVEFIFGGADFLHPKHTRRSLTLHPIVCLSPAELNVTSFLAPPDASYIISISLLKLEAKFKRSRTQ